ncbi:MATE family efflux transporter [Anaerovoracaceae bacterium 42-11]
MSKEEKRLSLMTEGNIFKKLIGFAVPVFFCSAFQQLYSTVDAIIVGRFVGTEGLAAIGVTGQIIMLAVSIGLGLMMGISTAVSEYCGAEAGTNRHDVYQRPFRGTEHFYSPEPRSKEL